jgi:hypothetical protein
MRRHELRQRNRAGRACRGDRQGAFDVCEQAGVPLSQLQKIALLEAALLEFDGLEAQLGSLAAVDQLIRGLSGPNY